MSQNSWNIQNFGQLLKTCIAERETLRGKSLHALYLKSLVPHTTYLSNHFIIFYSKCGSLRSARRTFSGTLNPNVFTFNALLAAYVANSMTHLARQLFDEMPQRDSVSYNTLISSYAGSGDATEALRLFSGMRSAGFHADDFTLSAAITACSGSDPTVRQLHSLALTGGFDRFPSVNNSLITCYGKSGEIREAERVFRSMEGFGRDEVSWNAIIAALGRSRDGLGAARMFQEMVRTKGSKIVDVFTLASLLTAMEGSSSGLQLHSRAIKSGFNSNAHVGSGLLDLHSKLPGGALGLEKIFEEVVSPDLIVWNAMITGYSRNPEFSAAAIDRFREMRRAGHSPDDSSFSGAIIACSNLSSPSQGKQIHSLAIESKSPPGKFSVSNALVTMYSKSGNLRDARKIFDAMPERDEVTMNSMIGAYAQHGLGHESLSVFEEMIRSRIEPTGSTFVSVLSACAHAGLVEEGRKHFGSMKSRFGIEPDAIHYSCLVDLLGRTGNLDEAEELVGSASFVPSFAGWAALLGACKKHGKLELALRAADRLVEIEPTNAFPYVTLANMYARAGKWAEAGGVRRAMRARGLRKKPGCSWIEVGKRVHYFMAEDSSHPKIREIHAYLAEIMTRIGQVGYVLDPRWAHVKEDEAVEGETEMRLGHHSEKLAVSFGLMSTNEGDPILVVKNLRICGDCHNAIKFISAVTGREITVRDNHRFHCFKEGHCSCRDFW